MTNREAIQQALEALRTLHDENMDYLTRNNLGGENNQCMVFARETITALRERLAQPEQEPVAWRDHVEQRILTWRQSFVNKCGDQLALDDFMDKQSLDDLIDFVCDEYAFPQPQMQPCIEAKLKEKNHG